jgi:cell division protein FtsB
MKSDDLAGLQALVQRQQQRIDEQQQALQRLTDRVLHLSDEIHDARSQGRRTGEIADMVVRLLVSESAQRDPEFQRIVKSQVREV